MYRLPNLPEFALTGCVDVIGDITNVLNLTEIFREKPSEVFVCSIGSLWSLLYGWLFIPFNFPLHAAHIAVGQSGIYQANWPLAGISNSPYKEAPN